MSSLIQGYEYDIFISYRQKDNRADHWVSQFVDALKDEIEATFKEVISIYFDENPHDGLLESHDVDLSLKKKLKCVIFIPILSQTYCDPQSFAWEHEFEPFLDMAKKDEYGLDITLPSGNVCKRVLPIRIHELDINDKDLFENAIGGVLRSIDFIYQTAGVNRPLTANEDNPHDNLNKTYYRDQINKVANAVKEVIGGVRGDKSVVIVKEVTESTNEIAVSPSGAKNLRIKIFLTASFILIALGLAYYFYSRSAAVNDGIAVLTFSDFSIEESNQYLAAGISEAIRINIGQASHLKVISRNSIEKFEKLGLSTPEIASKLGVKFVLDGSIQKEKNNIRINIELIEAKEDDQLWVKVYNKPYNDLLGMQNNIAIDIANKLNIATSTENSTYLRLKNPAAYDLYLKGMENLRRPTGARDEFAKNLQLFDSVLILEPNFAPAYLGKAQAYINNMFRGRANVGDIKGITIDLIMKAMEQNYGLSECYSMLGIIYFHDLDFVKSEEYLQKAIEINPNSFLAYKWKAFLSFLVDDREEAMACIEKAITIDPYSIEAQTDKWWLYSWSYNNVDRAISELSKIIEETNNDYAQFVLAQQYLLSGNLKKSIETMESRKVKGADTNWLLGYLYAINGDRVKALKSLSFNLEKRKSQYVPAFMISVLYIGLEDYENAMKWLEIEHNEGPNYFYLISMKNDFRLDPLEEDPRFEALLDQLPFERKRFTANK